MKFDFSSYGVLRSRVAIDRVFRGGAIVIVLAALGVLAAGCGRGDEGRRLRVELQGLQSQRQDLREQEEAHSRELARMGTEARGAESQAEAAAREAQAAAAEIDRLKERLDRQETAIASLRASLLEAVRKSEAP